MPPHGGPLPLTLHPNTTISQVMAVVAERHKLDPAHYNLALPAEDPKVPPYLVDICNSVCDVFTGGGCGMFWVHDSEQTKDPPSLPPQTAWGSRGGLAQQWRQGEREIPVLLW